MAQASAGGLGSLLSRVLRRSTSALSLAAAEEPPQPSAPPPDAGCAETVDAGTIEIDDDGELEGDEDPEAAGAAEPAAEEAAEAAPCEAIDEADEAVQEVDEAAAEVDEAAAEPDEAADEVAEAVEEAAAVEEAVEEEAVEEAAASAGAVEEAAPSPAPSAAEPGASAQPTGGPKPKWGRAPSRTSVPSPLAHTEYVVDNGALKADTMGLGFRRSKELEDVDAGSIARWGSKVAGVDEGDGWLVVAHRLGERFLPFEFNGVPVLTLVEPAASPAKASAASPPTAAGQISRSYSGQRFYTPNSPAVAQDASTPLSGLKRMPSLGGGSPLEPGAKRVRPEPDEDRPFDLQTVVVAFTAVGAEYAGTVMGKNEARGDKVFDWDGVRRCVRHLRFERHLQVIGVVLEHWWGQDRGRGSVSLPHDIKAMCSTILETPRFTGERGKVAEKEMAIKCAWRRNCHFVDGGDTDWRQEMCDEMCRAWLESSQDILQMSYFFECPIGTFRLLDC